MSADRPAPLGRTLRLARPRLGRLLAASLLGCGTVAAGIGLLATSAWLISRAAEHPSVQALALAVVAVRFFAIARGLLRYLERLVGHDAAFRVLADLRVRVYESLERLAPAGLPAFRSGDLLARLVDDVDTLQDLMLRVLPPYVVAVVVGLGVSALVGWLLPSAGILLGLLLATTAVAVPWLTSRRAAGSETRMAAARGELSTSVVDLLHGAPDLIAFGAAPAQLARAGAADAELTAISAAGARTAGLGVGLAALLGGLAVWGSVLVGVPAVRDGHLRGVLLAVLVLTPLAAFEAVAGLPAAAQSLQRVRRSAARVFEVMDAPVPIADPPAPAPLPDDGPARLEASALSARWPGSAQPAVRGVDLELSLGRRVAIVGASGAGKSTLAAVLLGFLPYEDGSVRLDGIELSSLAGDDVRCRIGLAAQDAHIFDTTLEENLRLARRDATDAELRDALSRARLLDWVDRLPDGLATRVGERGAAISGGQRQRLVVARALLARFPILVLDEPGANLDVATADALIADLLDAVRGCTTLLITHRLAGLGAVDEVLVLQAGRVVERGTHLGLLGAGGQYARMWAHERDTE